MAGQYFYGYLLRVIQGSSPAMPPSLLYSVLADPGTVFRELGRSNGDIASQLQRYLPMLLLLPPVCAAFGGSVFGWRLGTSDPLYLGTGQSITISLLYLLTLCFGFFSTVLLARWMGHTYGAEKHGTEVPFEVYIGFFAVVCAPLGVASVAHLFPHVFFNLLVLIPVMIWCMALLYRGLPVVLGIPPERGMLMSSALVGWLLVAAVSLLGLSAGLWTAGLGPAIRV